TRVRPRPRSVARCFSVWPLIPRTSFTFSAISGSLLRAHLRQLLAAQAGRFLGAAQLAQTVERGLHHVVRIPRPLRFGQDVADAHRLEHPPDAAAGDHAGSFACRLEQHAPRAEVTDHFVRNGVAREGHLEEVLLRLLAALADGLRHFVGLAEARADVALAVADHHER